MTRPNFTTAAAVLAVFSTFFWAQHDDAREIGNPPSTKVIADQEDADALTSREWAGQQACGPNKTPEWLDDKTLRCLRNLDDSVHMAKGQP
ncbi:hypothetical protein [Pulveribacter sp.]|uniref:hypothetical protein n=1 Tax=Pulveribacter sp. TaxID=2678893 RepID=UPI0028ADD473|nr:hypothetical protein [Pulveribacter sp.]